MDKCVDKIPNLNIEIIKKNIKEIMIHQNIKQAELVKILSPMSQPDVSKCLNVNDKRCFNIEQLFKISYALNVPLDDLTGLSQIKKYSPSEVSLSDAFEAFLHFYEIAKPKFQEIEINEKKRTCIYSDYKNVNDMISTFSSITKLDKEVLDAWGKVFIEKNQDKFKKYNFMEKNSCAAEWIMYWIANTFEKIELYRRIPDSDYYQKERSHENLVSACEMLYYNLQSDYNKINNFIYESIDDFIKEKNYSNSCAEYISLMIFKQIHEREGLNP